MTVAIATAINVCETFMVVLGAYIMDILWVITAPVRWFLKGCWWVLRLFRI